MAVSSENTVENVYCFARLPEDPDRFWEINHELTFLEPFASFVEKKNSAKVMCGIYLMHDPKSIQENYDIPKDQHIKDVSKRLFGKEDFSWREYTKYIRAYKKYTRTRIEKELDDWYHEMEERKQFMKDTSWDDDPVLKENMLGNNKKHFEDYQEILQALKEERQEMLMHGDYTPSLLEQKVL